MRYLYFSTFLLYLLTISCTGLRQTKTAAAATPWLAETVDKPLKIAVISDLNSSYGSTTYSTDVTAVIKQLAAIKPDIILCGGDMVAGQKRDLTEANITAMWDGFKNSVLNPISSLNIPFGFTVGNHDASPSFTTDRALAKAFWKENKAATNLTFVDDTHYPFYYSYIKNNVIIISWDAAGAQIPTEVYTWLEAQLQTPAAKNARLRIVLGHLPLYPIVAAKNKPGEVNAAPDSALTFFKTHGIDVYISGHQHAYYPAQKEGVVLFNAGAIGEGPRPILGHDSAAKKAYSIIEIPVRNARAFTHQTYMPVTNTVIDPNSLPDSIVGFNGVLYRQQ